MRAFEFLTEESDNFTFTQARRQLNIPELIKRGAIYITHPHGPDGWETDRPEWDFSLITLQNILQKSPDWSVQYKKYIRPESYSSATQDFFNKLSDQKYQQILWSIKKLGIPDEYAFTDNEQLDEMPLPADWDPEQLNLRQTFKNRLKYALDRAKRLGGGSSRVAMIIEYEGRPTVLKVAKNAKGLAQNEAEIEILEDGYSGSLPIVIPLIDFDQANKRPVWLQTEIAKKVQAPTLTKLLHSPSLWFFIDAVKVMIGRASMYRQNTTVESMKKTYFDERMWKGKKPTEQDWDIFLSYVSDLAELATSSTIELDDFNNASNWGVYNNRPVVIDLGFTEDTAQLYRR